MKILGLFSVYFFILMIINGLTAIFIDSRKYKNTKKYGVALIGIALILYAVGFWFSTGF